MKIGQKLSANRSFGANSLLFDFFLHISFTVIDSVVLVFINQMICFS